MTETQRRMRALGSRGGQRSAAKHYEYDRAMQLLDELEIERTDNGQPLTLDSRLARLAGRLDAYKAIMAQQRQQLRRHSIA